MTTVPSEPSEPILRCTATRVRPTLVLFTATKVFVRINCGHQTSQKTVDHLLVPWPIMGRSLGGSCGTSCCVAYRNSVVLNEKACGASAGMRALNPI